MISVSWIIFICVAPTASVLCLYLWYRLGVWICEQHPSPKDSPFNWRAFEIDGAPYYTKENIGFPQWHRVQHFTERVPVDGPPPDLSEYSMSVATRERCSYMRPPAHINVFDSVTAYDDNRSFNPSLYWWNVPVGRQGNVVVSGPTVEPPDLEESPPPPKPTADDVLAVLSDDSDNGGPDIDE